MSVSLDDIWSESLANSPSPPRREAVAGGADDDEEDSVFRPSKRPRSTLFLEDPDEGDGESTSLAKSAQGPGSAVPDISSLFDDLEEPAPAATTSKPFDLAAVRREAQRRAEKEAPASSFPKYAVQSSSPPRDGMDGEGKENAFGAHKGGDGGKEKRPIAKLDETRILGKDGLPALVQLCKDFKPKGKGHELSDLNRLFSVYQFWAHKMYPKITFSDTVNRVEKLCHSKRMHVSLSVWRDEAKGKIDGKDEDVEMRSDKGEESGDDDDVFGPRRENVIPSRASSSRASSEIIEPPVSRPPSSASDHDIPMDDDDPFDVDALLAEEEEMSRAITNTARHSTSAVKAKGGSASRNFTFDDDESEMWAELQDGPGAFDDNPPATASRTNSGQAQPPKEADGASAPRKSSSADDIDDDVWDIFDDMEKEQADASPVSAGTGAAPGASAGHPLNATAPGKAGSTAGSNDDDWDDMYV